MRIAVLSDIHSNLVALEAVLARIGDVDAIWHLGDVVGYGPEPDAVVERLAGLGAIGVLGNHDVVAIGEDDASEFNPEARTAALWTRDTIATTTRDWLADLPRRREEGEYTLVHASPRDPIWEYVLSSRTADECFPAFTTRHCLHGHTHVPVAYVERAGGGVEPTSPRDGTHLGLAGGRTLLNPGSVGQPRDGDPRASWATLDTDRAEISWHRVPYDIAATQARMRALRLPERLVTRLDVGQ